jgi:hypothetical protein
MTTLRAVGLIAVCAASGALGGYYAARFSPIQGQVAIVDMDLLLKEAIDNNQAKTEADGKALTERVKKATAPLVARGLVILDGQSVISAPDEAYVTVD